MNSPEISIIIPCYNHGKFLLEALKSTETIARKGIFEVVIVNDGSTVESTLEILQSLEKKGFKVINQVNKGLGAARNTGVKHSTGEYILPLDSDNKIIGESLLEARDILINNKTIDVLYGNALYFGEKTGVWEMGEFNLQRLLLDNFIDSCAIYKRVLWEKLGGYDENMPVMGVEDWDFWLRAASSGAKYFYFRKILFEYRFLNNSMIRSIDFEKRNQLNEYLDKKHSVLFNKPLLNEIIFTRLRSSKKLLLYVVLLSLFPSLKKFVSKLVKII